MEKRRVVITGLGAVSCVGNNVRTMWDSLVKGVCGIDLVTVIDASQFKVRIAGEVRGLECAPYMNEKERRRIDDYTFFAIAATAEALESAGLPRNFLADGNPGINPERVGVCVGSGIGGIRTIEAQFDVVHQKGPSRFSPFLIPMMVPNMASGNVSIWCGAQGPNFSVTSACASGTHAIGEAFCTIQRGDADIMVCGGTEAPISQCGLGGFGAMKALSSRNDDPKHASRPFDKDRDGFVMSEGAGVLVLEDLEHALKRGAHIYAEMIGYGASADAYHITSPTPGGSGCAAAIRKALDNAGINPESVDYINAHGTSTHLNDLYETQALKLVFGDYARNLAISSTKGAMGHSLGAAGALETIICAKTIETGIIPPTINYTTPDPECDLDYTPNTARERVVNVAVNENLGFGGHNGVLVLRRYEK